MRRRSPGRRVIDGPDWRQLEEEEAMADQNAPVLIKNDNSIDGFVGRDANRAESSGKRKRKEKKRQIYNKKNEKGDKKK